MRDLKDLIKITNNANISKGEQIARQIINLVHEDKYPEHREYISDIIKTFSEIPGSDPEIAHEAFSLLLKAGYLKHIVTKDQPYYVIKNKNSVIKTLETTIKQALFTYNISYTDIKNILDQIVNDRNKIITDDLVKTELSEEQNEKLDDMINEEIQNECRYMTDNITNSAWNFFENIAPGQIKKHIIEELKNGDIEDFDDIDHNTIAIHLENAINEYQLSNGLIRDYKN